MIVFCYSNDTSPLGRGMLAEANVEEFGSLPDDLPGNAWE